MLGLDTAFGRDGVAAFKKALAGLRPKVKVVAEEYAAGNTADFAPFAERLFNALKDKPGKKVIGFIWAGPHPLAKFVDMKPERFGIELAPGGNILPVMAAWKQFAGTEGGIYYYYDFPKNAMNDWLKAEYQKRYNAPPDFFVAGGFAAASAVVTALQKAGSTDTEKLIAAMEGMSFDTPKGTMTFRKEDHQALQDMYHWRIKKDAKDIDLLELVATIPAKDMPLPIRRRSRVSCAGACRPDPSRPASAALGCGRWIPAPSAGMTPEGSMAHPVLETRGLTIRFGGHVAVDGVSAAFHAGTLTAIVGPNGAGKTTYFNLISGQLPASAGQRAARRRRHHRAGRGGARQARHRPRLPAHQPVPQPHRARERAARRAGARRRRRQPPLALERAGSTGSSAPTSSSRPPTSPTSATSPAVALPHGDKRKLEVAIMMALEPHVFMFDEPTAGMSVDDVPVILDLIKALKGAGDKTILLVEHKMDVVRSLADRIVVLHNGRLVADGEPAAGDRLAGGAGGLSGHCRQARRGGSRPWLTRCSRSKACTPTSASTTSCRASTSRCRAAP